MSILQLVELPKKTDERGSLVIAEGTKIIPFEIKRVFYLYDIAEGQIRGAHAHKALHQFLICISGHFEVEVDNGKVKESFHLNAPHQGLHIPPLHWNTLSDFSSDAICLVFASDFYDEEDYYRDYDAFLKAIQ